MDIWNKKTISRNNIYCFIKTPGCLLDQIQHTTGLRQNCLLTLGSTVITVNHTCPHTFQILHAKYILSGQFSMTNWELLVSYLQKYPKASILAIPVTVSQFPSKLQPQNRCNITILKAAAVAYLLRFLSI